MDFVHVSGFPYASNYTHKCFVCTVGGLGTEADVFVVHVTNELSPFESTADPAVIPVSVR